MPAALFLQDVLYVLLLFLRSAGSTEIELQLSNFVGQFDPAVRARRGSRWSADSPMGGLRLLFPRRRFGRSTVDYRVTRPNGFAGLHLDSR